MKIVLTGGITGGHIYPALAIGDKFKENNPGCEIIYIAHGESLERSIIPAAGYDLYEVASEPLDRRNIFRLIGTIFKTLRGTSAAYKIMKKFKPDVVISTGSYVSVPVVFAGSRYGASIYIHEQNGFPGMSNRLLSRYVKKVFTGFESAKQYFKDDNNIMHTGNPVRKEFSGRDRLTDRNNLGINESDLVIMIFGGSLGSETTNMIGEAVSRKYADTIGYTVIWGTGKNYYQNIIDRFEDEGFFPSNLKISAYIENMPEILSASDISVSRSGAISTAEITMEGRAAIFVPSPNVTEDHQYYNAKAVVDKGGAFVVRENDETCDEVIKLIDKLDSDRDKIREMEAASNMMAPINAAEIIYDTIMETYK